MATPQDQLYFAVRKADGNEWIDVNSWGYVLVTTQEKSREVNERLPQWAKDNPVVRYAQFSLVETNHQEV